MKIIIVYIYKIKKYILNSLAILSASRLGLYAVGSSSLSGDKIDCMNDEDLAHIISSVSVFYRVGPGHKLRIVKVCVYSFYLYTFLTKN